jgi:hypothetical protein
VSAHVNGHLQPLDVADAADSTDPGPDTVDVVRTDTVVPDDGPLVAAVGGR